MTYVQQTRTEGTNSAYIKRAEGLCGRYFKQTGSRYDEDLHAFGQWLAGISVGLSENTLWQYRASLIAFAEQVKDQALFDIVSVSILPARAKASEIRTSAGKQKRIAQADLSDLSGALMREGEFGHICGTWLVCGVQVGLRPVEWRTAVLMREYKPGGRVEVILRVKNAKDTNDRAHGEYRHLILTDMQPGLIMQVEELIHEIQSRAKTDKEWATFLERCQKTIRRKAKSLFPRRTYKPTLYSARHQFSADLKNQRRSLDEIAALMGHATDETSSKHYGKMRHGWASTEIRASPEEVERVRKVFQAFHRQPRPALSPVEGRIRAGIVPRKE